MGEFGDLSRLSKSSELRIGLYSAGLNTYWAQFDMLYQRLLGYNGFISENLSRFGKVFNFGMVDSVDKGREAGEYFNENCVDIVFCHSATYFTSSTVLPLHQRCNAPVVILNLQPATEMVYDKTDTGEWLANCVSCSVPEVTNAFKRAGIKYRTVNGILGLEKQSAGAVADEITAERPEAKQAWNEIKEWCLAAKVKRSLANANFGYLGEYYSGMLDMYADFTTLQADSGIHIETLELCDLEKHLAGITQEEIQVKRKEIESFFVIGGDSPSDPIAKAPNEEQFEWTCRVAIAQERLVREHNLDALAYYYHGNDNYYEQIQSAFIVGHSLLTARGVPCSGEADIKTALAMKICDVLDVGGSFCEIVAVDFNRNTIIIGHDGPFHIKIANQKPILRGMGVYHGKRGNGISVEAKVKSGEITTLGLIQKEDGRLHMNISCGVAVDEPILLNGNTSTHVRFGLNPAEYMDKWFTQAPTHHFALSVGNNIELFKKTADLMNISIAVI